ncbi:helix-turn-helix domain-containing protein [Thermodesulfobacteriota bacterium]
MTPGWLKAKDAARYCSVSVRTIRTWLKDGLRHVRVRGSLLIKSQWIDEFLEGHEVNDTQLDQIVEQVVSEMRR